MALADRMASRFGKLVAFHLRCAVPERPLERYREEIERRAFQELRAQVPQEQGCPAAHAEGSHKARALHPSGPSPSDASGPASFLLSEEVERSADVDNVVSRSKRSPMSHFYLSKNDQGARPRSAGNLES